MNYSRSSLIAIVCGFIGSTLLAGVSIMPTGSAAVSNEQQGVKAEQTSAGHFKQMTFRLDTSGNRPIVLPRTEAPMRVEISITNIVFGPDPKRNAKESAGLPILLTGMIVRDPTSGLMKFRAGSPKPCPKHDPPSPGNLVDLDCEFAAENSIRDLGEPIGSLEALLQLDMKTGTLALVTKARGAVNSPSCCINLWF